MADLNLWLMARNPNLKFRWSQKLSEAGWSVIDVPASRNLVTLPLRHKRGSALLDASLLKESDIGLVRDLSAAKIPVILFGEGSEASNDRIVRWLELGADDFVPASIHERLLSAKLEAYARRIRPALDKIVLTSPERHIKADRGRILAWTRGPAGDWKATRTLTRTEHEILCLFLSKPEEVLNKTFMLEKIWGEKATDVFPATLTQHVMSLRKKLGQEGRSIRTIYGRGYMFLEESRRTDRGVLR